MANLPPGFVLDSAPGGGVPEGFSLDSNLKDGPNQPQQEDNPDDTMKWLAMMAKSVYGSATAGAKAGLAGSNPGTFLASSIDPNSAARGLKRMPEAEDATMAQGLSNFAGRAAIPTAVGMGAGLLTAGPVGMVGGGLRGVAATGLAAGAEGIAGEAVGQLAARGLGNKNALSGAELAGQGLLSGTLGSGARGTGEVLRAGIKPAGKAAKGAVALAAKYGIDLTPAEIAASRALSGLEAFLDKTLAGSGQIGKRREDSAEALRLAKDKLIAKAGTDKERQAVGIAFFDQIKERGKSFNNAVREVYSRAFSLVPQGERLTINNTMETAERLAAMSKRSPLGGGGAGPTGEKFVDFFDGSVSISYPAEREIAEAAAGRSVKIPKTPGSGGFMGEGATDPLTGGAASTPRKGYDLYAPPAGGRTVKPGDGLQDFAGAPPAAPDAGPYGIGSARPNPAKSYKIGPQFDPATGKKLPITISPQDLIEMRTDLTQAIADNDAGLKLGIKTMSSRQAGAYKMLLSSVERDMDAYAASGQVGKDFIAKYRSAKGLAKMNYDIFNSPNVVNVLKRNPDSVTSIIGRDSVDEIQKLKRAAGDKGFDEIRRLWMTGVLNESKTATGKGLANTLSGYTDDTLREVFKSDKSALADLQEIAQLQALVGSAERNTPIVGSGRAVVSTGISTLGALVGGTAGPVGGALGVLGANAAPYQVAKVYLSPTARKIVIDGLRAPAGSRAKLVAASKLAAFLGKASVSEGSEK